MGHRIHIRMSISVSYKSGSSEIPPLPDFPGPQIKSDTHKRMNVLSEYEVAFRCVRGVLFNLYGTGCIVCGDQNPQMCQVSFHYVPDERGAPTLLVKVYSAM